LPILPQKELKMIDAGKCVRQAQIDLDISSVELAQRTNSTPQQVVRWRSQPNMKIHTIEAICNAMDISIYDFLLYQNAESPN
tara:strand:+ start:88 stop:333 length:246 start_codon:yes stop_codon:yes gene_type:complete